MLKPEAITDISNQISKLNPDLANKAGSDAVNDYVTRAGMYVEPLGAPKEIVNMLIRLWALHLMTVDQNNYVTSKHIGDLSVSYSDLSKQDDDPLAEFKALLAQYGLGNANIYGF